MTIKDLCCNKKSSIRNLIDGLEKRYKIEISHYETHSDFLMSEGAISLFLVLELTKKKGVK